MIAKLLRRAPLLAVLACAGTACQDSAHLPDSADFGSHPALPTPHPSLIPTVKIAPAVGWPAGAMPVAAPGLAVHALAENLEHPRWLYVLPNGDVLVAETDAPRRPDDLKGIKGWIVKKVMKRAGYGDSSANRITLLRGADAHGVAVIRTIFLEGLNSPFGMALVGNELYVANTDAVLRFDYVEGETHLNGKGTKVVDLPAGPIDHHWTKNLIATADGTHLYVTVGSNSNAGENGLDQEAERAAVWEVNLADGSHRIFASGLRNPNGLAWEPRTGALWTVVNERDELGSDLVPDYMTALKDGAFYGWPYSYFGPHVDWRVKPQRPDLVAIAIAPDYALGSHTASLGLVYLDSSPLLPMYHDGMFVGQHGSWNRRPPSGYKVIFVPFANGRPRGSPVDVLSGFLGANGDAYGRPVGVALDKAGALLVADDVGNAVWHVAASAPATTQ
ncbi:MAG TPA: sorbosone dehydrogenase family protein [Steroidobacteraceae bacterium]|nr:sorbosone dehydrogenase family protein [Steroidobacteraceae bacterium]